MTFSEETLMAYADGELDPQTRAAVEAAMKTDPEIARRIAHHKALRGKMRLVFDRALEERVPERMIAAVRSAPAPISRPTSNVIPLRRKSPARWSTPQWGAVAASLVIGGILGQLLLRSTDNGPVARREGRIFANGKLARTLSSQLTSETSPTTPVQIGVSFRSKSGAYCRTFLMHDESSLAGLACRDQSEWQVRLLTQAVPETNSTESFQPTASGWSRAITQAVEDEMAGTPLDAKDEQTARDRDWLQH